MSSAAAHRFHLSKKRSAKDLTSLLATGVAVRLARMSDVLPSLQPRRNLLRRDLLLANLNAAIWAIGNGLVSTTLVVYLALELGAPGAAIGFILAAPRLAGLLRLGVPRLLESAGRRKPLCIGFFAASAAVLFLLPLVIQPAHWSTPWNGSLDPTPALPLGLTLLVVSWCLYHLLEFCAAVLLWAWLGDMMPRPLRGRLIGSRERWLVIGRVIGMGTSLLLAIVWRMLWPDAARWQPLGWSAMAGAAVLLLSVLPLLAMRPYARTTRQPSDKSRSLGIWQTLCICLTDRRYRRLLAFSCCFALANGLTAAAQGLYAGRVLGVSYESMIGLRSAMRGGQAILAPWAGGWIDRAGGKRIMLFSQLLVATGPLFYLIATPAAPWWIAGAFLVWICYAPLNVGLDHWKLALAPTDDYAPSLATYYALSDLANGLMAIVGGLLYDRLTPGDANALQLYGALFLAGWLARTAVAGLLWRIPEPANSTQ